jgi:hypothetical protein
MTKPGTPASEDVSAKRGLFGRMDASFGRWVKGWNPYGPDKVNRRSLQPVQVEESAIRRNAAMWFLAFFSVFLGSS